MPYKPHWGLICLGLFLLGMAVAAAAIRLWEEENHPIRYTLGTAASNEGDPLSDIRVKDGDTIEADIHLGYGVVLDDKAIRLEGLDAWEVSRRRQTVEVSDQELLQGRVARDALSELLESGQPVLAPSDARDPYGRILGRLSVVTDQGVLDVAEWMMVRGHDRARKPDGSQR